MNKFSVLLLYPHGELETYYTHVVAENPAAAVAAARAECRKENGIEADDKYWTDDTLECLLVCLGHNLGYDPEATSMTIERNSP